MEPNKTTAKMCGPLPLYSLHDQIAESLLGRMSSKFLSSVVLAVVNDTCFGNHVKILYCKCALRVLQYVS
jgi:hypothetical protein